ncbi:MAG: hypothetical protein MUC49_12970 [Raineya sp.]|jgi:hypothetical protein|nr:hypothetical protein [Raineya sp.]
MKNKVKFDTESPKAIKEFLQSQKLTWVYNPDEEQDEDFAFFFFLGKYKNKDVVFDAAFFPLSVHYASIIEENAEEEIRKLYPEYDGEDSKLPNSKLEEILEHKAEIIAEMEAEESLKVQEFIDFDDDFEEGNQIVLLTVSLNIDEINEEEIEKFVKSFNDNTFKLDENLYSFSLEEED